MEPQEEVKALEKAQKRLSRTIERELIIRSEAAWDSHQIIPPSPHRNKFYVNSKGELKSA